MDPPGSPKDRAALPGPPAVPAASVQAPAAAEDKISELSPEEQMKRFEQELKETDWGHQPC